MISYLSFDVLTLKFRCWCRPSGLCGVCVLLLVSGGCGGCSAVRAGRLVGVLVCGVVCCVVCLLRPSFSVWVRACVCLVLLLVLAFWPCGVCELLLVSGGCGGCFVCVGRVACVGGCTGTRVCARMHVCVCACVEVASIARPG